MSNPRELKQLEPLAEFYEFRADLKYLCILPQVTREQAAMLVAYIQQMGVTNVAVLSVSDPKAVRILEFSDASPLIKP